MNGRGEMNGVRSSGRQRCGRGWLQHDLSLTREDHSRRATPLGPPRPGGDHRRPSQAQLHHLPLVGEHDPIGQQALDHVTVVALTEAQQGVGLDRGVPDQSLTRAEDRAHQA